MLLLYLIKEKMVSEKIIVILITLAIILSIVSIAVTISSMNTPKLTPPKVNINTVPGNPDSDKAQVSFGVANTPTP